MTRVVSGTLALYRCIRSVGVAPTAVAWASCPSLCGLNRRV
ncbi:MAG: hypothetical protein NZ874_07740 [Fimbriimonadales bacterium]|nr:hypothetical protein [Fimbriimonadales bacterium]